jgi:hypothetical protein
MSPSRSRSRSPPQLPPIETAHEGPPVAAETPQQAQPVPGTLSASVVSTGPQRSATPGSLIDESESDRSIMAENAVPSISPPPPTTLCATDDHAQAGSGHRDIPPPLPDPTVAAPNVSEAVSPPSPTESQRKLSIVGRILDFFGYGQNNRERKELVSFISSVALALSQVSR